MVAWVLAEGSGAATGFGAGVLIEAA